MRKAKKIKYISTRMVSRKSRSAFQEGAKFAMRVNGYAIEAHDGWVVKKFSDGRIEKMKELDNNNQDLELILD